MLAKIGYTGVDIVKKETKPGLLYLEITDIYIQ